ncbi:MAG TPA: hypothetical protein VF795_07380 [Desulfuromonadaceae bacterium]
MRATLPIVALIPLLIWGCAAKTSITGSDFMSSAISRIEKGTTTTAQILAWIGEPYERRVVSPSETVWIYNCARPTADPNVVPFGMRAIGNRGYRKSLWLMIKDDVVVNYTYEEGII